MQWPKGLALRELFGFYDFTNDNGDRMVGFSKGVGTLWEPDLTTDAVDPGKNYRLDPEALLPVVQSANEAWKRKQQKGADIGSVVHDAIEHYVTLNPNVLEPVFNKDGEATGKTALPAIRRPAFDIGEQYMWNIKEAITDIDSPEYDKAMEDFKDDVDCAKKAFEEFTKWWDSVRPVLYGAEDLLYSKIHNVCGTYDGDLGIKKEHHPIFKDKPLHATVISKSHQGRSITITETNFKGPEKDIVRVTADWKTSNASSSKDAAAPEGVYYSYFIQLAIYELCRREMGFPPADDLLTVSARKDGGFSLIYASELGLSVQDCIDWAIAVITCHKFMVKAKKGLLAHPEEEK